MATATTRKSSTTKSTATTPTPSDDELITKRITSLKAERGRLTRSIETGTARIAEIDTLLVRFGEQPAATVATKKITAPTSAIVVKTVNGVKAFNTNTVSHGPRFAAGILGALVVGIFLAVFVSWLAGLVPPFAPWAWVFGLIAFVAPTVIYVSDHRYKVWLAKQNAATPPTP
jgi:hypothetical protein